MDNPDDIVVQVDGLWKSYGIPPSNNILNRIKRSILLHKDNIPDKSNTQTWALQDINFKLKRGETFGVIGRNGSGKSTLLKILALTSPPSIGSVKVNGRIFSMIELTAGMNPELTGRENVRLLGTIMGFSTFWIGQKIKEIEEFCELGEWFNRPVWQYSSGMTVRLGFAVAVNAEADVLLIDEVLAVGDLPFQKKCHDKLDELHQKQMTTVFVSHNIRQVERLCQNAMFLHQGKIKAIGEAVVVANAYYEFCNEEEKANTKTEASLRQTNLPNEIHLDNNLIRWEGTGHFFITRYEFIDESGQIVKNIITGKKVTLRLHIHATEKTYQPVIGISIMTNDFFVITAFGNQYENPRPDFHGTSIYDCVIDELILLKGIYRLRLKVIDKSGALLFSCQDAGTVVVNSDGPNLASAGVFKSKILWQLPQEK